MLHSTTSLLTESNTQPTTFHRVVYNIVVYTDDLISRCTCHKDNPYDRVIFSKIDICFARRINTQQ